jgi:phage recombination protein Bet
MTALVKTDEVREARYTQDQIELIKRTCCPGATDDEFQLFMYQAYRTGLDPLARQIYAVKRWDSKLKRYVMAIQTAIDGFRLTADRHGKYAGQLGPFWCGADAQWRDVWMTQDPPIAARVAALRSDFKEPCWGVARYESYVQKTKDGQPIANWQSMPDVMIAKCAEALALRKAFPQELSGLYTSDEMAHVQQSGATIGSGPDFGDGGPGDYADDRIESGVPEIDSAPEPSFGQDKITKEQLDRINNLADEAGIDKRKFCQWFGTRHHVQITSMPDIPPQHYDDAVNQLELRKIKLKR